MKDLSNEPSVEEFFVSRLLKDLGYSDSEIKPKKGLEELTIGRGRKKESHRPDYVCFAIGKPRLVVEVKAVDEIIDEWLYQGQGYAFELNKGYTGEKPVRYVLMTNGVLTKLYHWDELNPILALSFIDFRDGNDKFDALKSYVVRSEIAKPLKERPSELFWFKKPEDIEDVKNLFRRCHRAIRKAEKMGPSPAFYEFTKMLFIKLHQDQLLRSKEELRRRILTGEPLPVEQVTFRVGWIDQREDEGEPNPVDKILFQNLRDHLQEQVELKKKKRIFDMDEHIKLEPPTIKEIVGMLEHYDLFGINEDLNGRLFETFLSAMMRGKELGQFFTPRSIVKFMVATANLKADDEHIDKVLDACCGTAGFLVETMDDMAVKVNANPSLSTLEKQRLIDKIRNECLWGIDAGKEPPIARIARINMYLHEDGGSRIYQADSLDKDLLIDKGIDRELKRDREELR
jgi:type I restriction enzyme M protein